MSSTVGIAELRKHLSRYLRRVEKGERLIVTNRNRPVAEHDERQSAAARLAGLRTVAPGSDQESR